MASPVLSSVAECVTLYCDSLATKQRCGLRLRAGSLWRVGSACSGTDSVVKVLEHLGRSSDWHFEHTFSCERDDAKQTWMQENFPQLALIFDDICDLQSGRGFQRRCSRGNRRPGCGCVRGRLRVQVRVYGKHTTG